MERVKDDEKSLCLCISVSLYIIMNTGNMRVFKHHLLCVQINAKKRPFSYYSINPPCALGEFFNAMRLVDLTDPKV